MGLEEAKRLAAKGYGRKAIAERLGISHRQARKAIEAVRGKGHGFGGPPPLPTQDKKPAKMTLGERAILSEQTKKFAEDATPEDCINDLRRVQEASPLRFITRTAYRAEGRYSEATWSRYFGTFQEFRRQAGLELSRHQHQHEKQIAKHSSLDHYKRFFREEVAPYVGLYERKGKAGHIKTIVAGSDFHDKDADDFTLSVFIDTCYRMQPDVILLNGDVFDMYEFSRYDVDPRQVDIKGRFDFVKTRIFGPLREACPDAQIDFLLGNHEWRLLKHLADKTPHLKTLLSDVVGLSLEDIFGVREFEINLHCRWDFAAFMKSDVKKQVSENYIVYWDTFVAAHIDNFGFGLSGTSGHTHKPKTLTNRNLAAGRITWTTTGSICKTGAEYISDFDRACNGFGIFHVNTKDKSVVPENVIIPGDFAVVAGKYYHRQQPQRPQPASACAA